MKGVIISEGGTYVAGYVEAPIELISELETPLCSMLTEHPPEAPPPEPRPPQSLCLYSAPTQPNSASVQCHEYAEWKLVVT